MKEKVCPKCLLDDLDNWFLSHHWQGTDDEHIGMIEQGMEMVTTGIEEGIPAACLCEIHRNEMRIEAFTSDWEVRLG